MRTLGNLLWFVFGGLGMGIGWCVAGLVMAVTIVGIPWSRSCFVMGALSFWPFGREVISRKELTGKDDLGTSSLGVIGNLVWLVAAGFWLALGHLLSAVVCFLSIIGIPFGIQHLKLAGCAAAPIGKTVVLIEVAAEARRRNVRKRTSPRPRQRRRALAA